MGSLTSKIFRSVITFSVVEFLAIEIVIYRLPVFQEQQTKNDEAN